MKSQPLPINSYEIGATLVLGSVKLIHPPKEKHQCKPGGLQPASSSVRNSLARRRLWSFVFYWEAVCFPALFFKFKPYLRQLLVTTNFETGNPTAPISFYNSLPFILACISCMHTKIFCQNVMIVQQSSKVA